jgi:FixJ family two-component response regulator
VLAERLVARRPDLGVVFVTGYSADMLGVAAGARRAFLPKPFSAAALIAAVQGVMASEVETK